MKVHNETEQEDGSVELQIELTEEEEALIKQGYPDLSTEDAIIKLLEEYIEREINK
jgi:hypothetical protein